jgi:hypothetical protein
MRALGRRGGLRGGPARAKKLDARQRSEIARDAAMARWKPTVITLGMPKDLDELRCFVAQYGNGHARAENCDPTGVLIRAVSACRDDAGLARMIPVYVHRACEKIFADQTRLLAVPAVEARVLGYLLELTTRFSAVAVPPDLIRSLRRKIHAADPPVAFFRKALAAPRISALAQSWKLVVSEPDDSYESYFAKVAGDQRPVFRRRPGLRAAP